MAMGSMTILRSSLPDPNDRDTDRYHDDATEFGDGEEPIDTDEDGLIDAEDEDSDGDTV